MLKFIIFVFLSLCLGLNGLLYADDVQSTAPPGHDYARQVLAMEVAVSDEALKKKERVLLELVADSGLLSDDEHNSETRVALAELYQAWHLFRDAQCEVNGYLHVYPADSRLFSSEYNACRLRMNRKRIDYLDRLENEIYDH